MKTLAVKECEIKKLEASNRRYQVAVDIMKKFVEVRYILHINSLKLINSCCVCLKNNS